MSYSNYIINTKTLKNNLKNIKCKKICAMVKANAYGLGVKNVCPILKKYVNYFGVATVDEAVEIRQFDKTTKILVVGISENYEQCVKNNIEITIGDYHNFLLLEKFIKQNKVCKIKIHLKINSGMNRYGFKSLKDFQKVLKAIKNNKNIELVGIFTHFSNLKNKDCFNQEKSKFDAFLSKVKNKENLLIHYGGGEADNVMQFKPNEMLRVGFNLFQNVVVVKSKVVAINVVKKGENVGYNGTYIAPQKTKIAVVGMGYADGVNWQLSNKGTVKIKNQLCKIIGNVCMDVFFVDVNGVNVEAGDDVVVFDNAFEWAKICETSPYEILTSFNQRRMEVCLI